MDEPNALSVDPTEITNTLVQRVPIAPEVARQEENALDRVE